VRRNAVHGIEDRGLHDGRDAGHGRGSLRRHAQARRFQSVISAHAVAATRVMTTNAIKHR
jgi:hypothetical protein